jgi:hypothetical protein
VRIARFAKFRLTVLPKLVTVVHTSRYTRLTLSLFGRKGGLELLHGQARDAVSISHLAYSTD